MSEILEKLVQRYSKLDLNYVYLESIRPISSRYYCNTIYVVFLEKLAGKLFLVYLKLC